MVAPDVLVIQILVRVGERVGRRCDVPSICGASISLRQVRKHALTLQHRPRAAVFVRLVAVQMRLREEPGGRWRRDRPE